VACKTHANDAARGWNETKVFPIRAQNLNSGVGRNIKAALRIDRHSVTVATAFKAAEFPQVSDQSVGPDIERDNRRPVGHIELFVVTAEDDAVGLQPFA